MNQFLEAAGIALQAIWSNKLRSFLTVLGNIVAVTSIIAVVSLIQGMNAYVTDAIVTDVGADNFNIQREPIVLSEADEERARGNPPITMEDAAAVRKSGDDNILAVATQGNSRTKITYKNETLNSVRIQGVSREYIFFSTFDAERGRPISPTEVDRERQVAILGFETAEQLKALLPDNDWHASRSSVLIHATTRWAVWKNSFDGWRGKRTATGPILGPQKPEVVRQEPVKRPTGAELPAKELETDE